MSHITRCLRLSPRTTILQSLRTFTTTHISRAEPVLPRLREDLKTAMRAKDTLRLSVLRSLLADITNASKTPSPITTDLHLLTLLKKRIGSSCAAAEEFRRAKREDIAEKEEAQVRVMEEYLGGIETVDEDEIRRVVGGFVEKLRGEGGKVDLGSVVRGVLDGELEGRPVERGEVVRVVKGVLGM